jgi:hypothetical protein
MDKRYQVFISSTYADLKEERRSVIQTVIELNCLPAGMELFPAADETQLAFIKRVIDDCDYYLLIIGGKYGSVDESGISYTEQEYEYAVSCGLRVIALVHENPDDIPLGKSEKDAASREKLQKFRDRVCKGRLVKFWKNPSELPGLVALNLSHAMNTYPAVGWVRANKVANVEVLGEINDVRKRNAQLEAKLLEYKAALADLSPRPALKDLAGLDEGISLKGEYRNKHFMAQRSWSIDTTWRKIFAHISPYLVKHPNEEAVKHVLTSTLFAESSYASEGYGPDLDDQNFQTVGVQLSALGLVKIEYSKTTSGGMALFWSFTGVGERLMVELRAVRAKAATTDGQSTS